jgi:glutaredoxin-related protein
MERVRKIVMSIQFDTEEIDVYKSLASLHSFLELRKATAR